MDTTQLATLAVFGVTLILVAVFRNQRTALVLCGAAAMGFLHPASALGHVDVGMLGLWLGMLVLASGLRQAGLSQYLAVRTAKAVRGNPVAILLLYCALTMVFSAVVGSVPAIFLMVPVSLLVAVELDISPLPFVISEAVAAGIGGAATLVGDPATMVVGSAFGLGFVPYSATVLPYLALVAAVFFLAVAVVFRPKMRVTNERKARILDFDASRSLPDGAMLRPMMTILLAVLFGFVLANWISFPLALVAWAGAGALMLVVGPKEAMRQLAESDWDGLVFVGGLFVLVGGLVDSSLTAALVPELARFPLQILWGSALLSSLVDNVTAVTVLTPVLQALAGASGTHPVWLPLVLGGALGGGATLLGAWANLTAASIAGKSGYKLPFWAFTRYALIFALLNLFVVSGLLLLPTLAML